ncbi:MAG: group II intron reverse transcriptase/maturase [Mastigocoleus sp. MO_167.B18]|nr:group II intron reverse transcriptase/maturase [Mastigocoleus sp. MO_167.B18]
MSIHTVEWNNVNWKQVNRHVFRLQKRIYQASQRGEVSAVQKLQKLLIKSWYAKLLAVRKVTQDNRGRKTAGFDGVKELNPVKRIKLAKSLILDGNSKPVKRIYIPKPGRKEKRPLGIPTINERAKQALAKLALEPEWEAKFESNSYGFRPGRSAQDAIAAIYADIRCCDYYVLDADIEKCFDKINHRVLLDKLKTFPEMRRQIKAWLKTDILEKDGFITAKEGTPQGGVISPLLANIALHGLKEHLTNKFPKRYCNKALSERYHLKADRNIQPPIIHRYADDFVILHQSKKLIEECKVEVEKWLSHLGLNLKESKTRIAHTRNNKGTNWGFDYLGYNIRQYEVVDSASGRNKKGNLLGFKTLIKPAKSAVKKHIRKIGDYIRKNRNISQEKLIDDLNLIIRGWTSYYSTVVSSRIFGSIDNIIFQQLTRWATYRSPSLGKKKVMGKYWSIDTNGKWDFETGKKKLLKHKDTKIEYRTRLIGSKSPFDGDWLYWGKRLANFPHISKRFQRLLKKQKGKCAQCNLNFTTTDIVEIDHIIPLALGGKNRYNNLQLLHGHCHDIKTHNDTELIRIHRQGLE